MISVAQSLALRLRELAPEVREKAFAALKPRELEALLFHWPAWARPEQLPPPGDWRTWGIVAGRFFGKTRAGAEWVRAEVESGRMGRIALVAPTAADARDVMVEGESGLLAISPRWFRPSYEPSKRRLTWPNGAMAFLYSSEEPDRLRGPQHHGAWADEFAAWTNLQDTIDMLLMGLRLGAHPRWIFTTTPRPLPILRRFSELAAAYQGGVVLTQGTIFDNAGNAPQSFLDDMRARYEGTELGRQELLGEILDDRRGAIFSGSWIKRVQEAPPMRIKVVGVDPAVTTHEGSDETGIIVAGLGEDGRAYVLADRSGQLTPEGMAGAVLKAFADFDAHRVVIETNRGGHFVRSTLESALRGRGIDLSALPIVEVNASRGKATRAEPLAVAYEQGRVSHVGQFDRLEKQMIEWDPARSVSPDRIDALVWAMTSILPSGPSVAESFAGLLAAQAVIPAPTWAEKRGGSRYGAESGGHLGDDEEDGREWDRA